MTRVVEEPTRLSRSLLWRLQQGYYADAGMSAWSTGQVPSFITSNTFFARAYARVVHAFLRDCAAWRDDGADRPIDPAKPLTILELGSGSGRFAYRFLLAMERLLAREPVPGPAIRLVMTDFTEVNIEAWRAHPKLVPFVARGMLDFARFDADSDELLRLLVSGETLAAGKSANSLIAIANYVFDGLPQDLFRLAEGEAHEVLVSLSTDKADGAPPSLDEVNPGYSDGVAVTGSYYADADFDSMIDDYRRQLGETYLLFPASTLRCLRRLRALGGDRLFLLAADKGVSELVQLIANDPPPFVRHGSFSLPLNFHAVAGFVLRQDGVVLAPDHFGTSLHTGGYALGISESGLAATISAYCQAIEQNGPDDFCATWEIVRMVQARPGLDEVIACIRFSGWDSDVFLSLLDAVNAQIDSAHLSQRMALLMALREVWTHHFSIGRAHHDIAFAIGAIMMRIECFPDAMEYFQRSLRDHGPNPSTHFNIALCLRVLRRLDEAVEAVNAALAMDPTGDSARSLLIQLEAEMGERGAA